MHRRFRIGLPKIHRQLCFGPPKMHRWFFICPLQVSLNLLPPEFHRREFVLSITIMKEKQQNNLFEIECLVIVTQALSLCAELQTSLFR